MTCVCLFADPWWFNQKLRRLSEAVFANKVVPLPQQSFALHAVQKALRMMEQGSNLGKVVLHVNVLSSSEITGIATELLDRNASERGKGLGTLVRLAIGEKVAMLELHDPQRFNVLSWGLGDDMRRAVEYLQDRSDTVRALALHGAGHVFCAGGDPYDSSGVVSVAASARLVLRTIEGVAGIRRLGMPAACAVHGAMVGGAAAIFLHADVRAAEASATFQHGNSRCRSLAAGLCSLKRLVVGLGSGGSFLRASLAHSRF